MKCSHCGKVNTKDAEFCSECGKPLGKYCPNCKAPVTAEDKFCKKCGTELQKNTKKKNKPQNFTEATNEKVKTKKKLPLWALIPIGIIILACVIVLVFGDINFSVRKTGLSSSPTATIQTNLTLPTTTATFEPTPTPVPTPMYKPATVNFMCEGNQVQFALEDQPVTFYYGWYAETEQQIADFLFSSSMQFSMDGVDITPLMTPSQPSFNDDLEAWLVNYTLESEPLPKGPHTIVFSQTFNKPFSDGFAEYGPGTGNEQFAYECYLMVGAPQEDWEVIARSDFFNQQGLMYTGEVKQSGATYIYTEDNTKGVYRVTIDASNADMAYADPSCLIIPSHADIIVTAEGRIIQGGEDAWLGVKIRGSESGEGVVYRFAIQPTLQKFEFHYGADEGGKVLLEGESPAIRPDGSNELTILAMGEKFSLWINRQLIGLVEDEHILQKGLIGMYTGPFSTGETIYEFTNFVASSPVQ